MNNLETTYLILKIIALAFATLVGVSIALSILYQGYISHKEWKKKEEERIKKEKADLLNPKIIKERADQERRMGFAPTPGDHYTLELRCHNCDEDQYFHIKKGILEVDFRKDNFCFNCGCGLDYKTLK